MGHFPKKGKKGKREEGKRVKGEEGKRGKGNKEALIAFNMPLCDFLSWVVISTIVIISFLVLFHSSSATPAPPLPLSQWEWDVIYRWELKLAPFPADIPPVPLYYYGMAVAAKSFDFAETPPPPVPSAQVFDDLRLYTERYPYMLALAVVRNGLLLGKRIEPQGRLLCEYAQWIEECQFSFGVTIPSVVWYLLWCSYAKMFSLPFRVETEVQMRNWVTAYHWQGGDDDDARMYGAMMYQLYRVGYREEIKHVLHQMQHLIHPFTDPQRYVSSFADDDDNRAMRIQTAFMLKDICMEIQDYRELPVGHFETRDTLMDTYPFVVRSSKGLVWQGFWNWMDSDNETIYWYCNGIRWQMGIWHSPPEMGKEKKGGLYFYCGGFLRERQQLPQLVIGGGVGRDGEWEWDTEDMEDERLIYQTLPMRGCFVLASIGRRKGEKGVGQIIRLMFVNSLENSIDITTFPHHRDPHVAMTVYSIGTYSPLPLLSSLNFSTRTIIGQNEFCQILVNTRTGTGNGDYYQYDDDEVIDVYTEATVVDGIPMYRHRAVIAPEYRQFKIFRQTQSNRDLLFTTVSAVASLPPVSFVEWTVLHNDSLRDNEFVAFLTVKPDLVYRVHFLV